MLSQCLGGMDWPRYRSQFSTLQDKVGRKDPVILEVGAHHGEDTIRMLKTFPEATIYCFEPDHRNYPVFEKYVGGVLKQDRPRAIAELVPVAVSDKDEQNVTFFMHSVSGKKQSKYDYIADDLYNQNLCGSGSSSLCTKPGVNTKTATVDTVRLDTWCMSKENIDRIDMVWVDVQGAERMVIQGGASLVFPVCSHVWIEYGELGYNGAMSRDDTIALLNTFGLAYVPECSDKSLSGNMLFSRPKIARPMATVTVEYDGRLGNQLFQYCYARLLAERHNARVLHLGIAVIDVPASTDQKTIAWNKQHSSVSIVSRRGEPDAAARKRRRAQLQRAPQSVDRFYLRDYCEDFELFQPYLWRIREWFSAPTGSPLPQDVTVVHFRHGDVFVDKTNGQNVPTIEAWTRVLSAVPGRLHVVSTIRPESIEEDVRRELRGCAKPYSLKDAMVRTQRYVDMFQSMPNYEQWVCQTEREDFDYLRRCTGHLVFSNSTFGWWGATLSSASDVHVYGPWRPRKGAQNKNLGKTNYPGWSSWR